MEITLSILGLALLVLIVLVFSDSLGEIILIIVAFFIAYQCSDDVKKEVLDGHIEIKIDTASNSKLINVKNEVSDGHIEIKIDTALNSKLRKIII